MPGYPESMRKQLVQRYQEQWREDGISIDQFAENNRVHHTTMRAWIKRYDPEFDRYRKNQKSQAFRKITI